MEASKNSFGEIADGRLEVAVTRSTLSDEVDTDVFKKQLHDSYLRDASDLIGEKIPYAPLLLTPFEHACKSALDYPFVRDTEKDQVYSLTQILETEFNNTFNANEADHLSERLIELAGYIREEKDTGFREALSSGLARLVQDFSFADENLVFEGQCKRLQEALFSKEWDLIDANDELIFKLLNIQIQKRNDRHTAFLAKLMKVESGLRDLLALQDRREGKGEVESHYSFVGDLLSINEIDKVAEVYASSDISKLRLDSIRRCVETLEKARASYEEYSCIAFVSSDLTRQWSLSEHLFSARLSTCEKNTLQVARQALAQRKVITFALKGKANLVAFPDIPQCVNWPWKILLRKA